MSRILFVLALSCCAVGLAEDASWPGWRGPGGQGHADGSPPVRWSDTENVAWKTPIPGKGWSTPVIEGNRIWMTTAIEQLVSEEEKKRRLASNTGGQPLTVAGDLSLRAVCVDAESGKLLHNIELMIKTDPQPVHTLNSFASPSPVIEDGQLYTHFGSYGTARLDTTTGKVIWTRQDIIVAHENGPGSTPILWGDLMVFHMDGSDRQFVIALDKATGETVWKTDRSGEMRSNPQLKKAYGTPLVLKIEGDDVLVSPGADWLYGYDPATGKELWRVNYGRLGFSIVPRPVTGHGRLYMSTSFMDAAILALDYADRSVPKIAWEYDRQVPKTSSPTLIEDELYFVSDRGGILTCLDAHTGEVNYVKRIGGNHSASPLAANGRLYLFSREGVTTVIEAGPEYRKLATNKLDGPHMASAAVIGDVLYLRTGESLYKIAE